MRTQEDAKNRVELSIHMGRTLFSSPSLHLCPHRFGEANGIPCPVGLLRDHAGQCMCGTQNSVYAE